MEIQVLLEPTLLFEVLAQLPMQDLLLAQRVCRTWTQLITSSTILQTKLFFLPVTSDNDHTEATDSQGHLDTIYPNPLLQGRFPSFFDQDSYSVSLRLCKNNLGPWESTHWYRGGDTEEQADGDPLQDDIRDQERGHSYSRREASWRRMMPCRPAPTELQLYTGSEGRGGSTGTFRWKTFPNDPQQRLSTTRTGRHGSKRRRTTTASSPWLTFGIVYDLAQYHWFHGCTSHSVTQITIHLGLQDREDECFWEKHVPQRQVGGPGKVFLEWRNIQQCCKGWLPSTGSDRPQPRIYENEFRTKNSSVANKLRWDQSVKAETIRG